MAKPAICLADEPTGNLDRKNTEEVVKLFREMKERFGQTILMVTHDGLVISDVAARV
jgi:putative ABC transport system ATP-binding protein